MAPTPDLPGPFDFDPSYTDPPNRPRRLRLKEGEAERLVAEVAERLVAEVDGLQVDPETGRFRRRGLIDGWVVVGVVRHGQDGLDLEQLAIQPEEPGTGSVTSRLLREIPVGAVLAEVRQRLMRGDAIQRTTHLYLYGEAPADEPLEIPDGRRRGRLHDSRKQAQLRRLAIAYIDEQGQRGVYARLARRFRQDPEAIKALIRAARVDGWLSTATRHGKRSAEPGPRLLQDDEFIRRGER